MYLKQELQIGYKNSFVIQEHDATNLHWDLRLVFPVDSLKKHLGKYIEKRLKDTTEPLNKRKDEKGYVLRSWAVPKHKIPEDKPLLATETEDHDLDYKDFEGDIPEGHYGAGKVKIYDKGTFEIVDIEYDKKYVIKFNGKKIKGYYSLIKTKGKDFLFIKVKNTEKYKKSFDEKIILKISNLNGSK